MHFYLFIYRVKQSFPSTLAQNSFRTKLFCFELVKIIKMTAARNTDGQKYFRGNFFYLILFYLQFFKKVNFVK